MTDILTVYYHSETIGSLRKTKGLRYVFSYDEKWLGRGDAIPISISLPLNPGEFDEERSMSFFSNLLPESTIREKLAQQFRISDKDSYGLLEIVGGECAGAISLIPNNKNYTEGGDYEEIPNEKLNSLLADISKRPLLAGDKGVRLSLAGAQDKLPIYFDDGKFFLPIGNNASSHIIKTPISDEYPYSVLNEAFCMILAGELDLPVPEVSIIRDSHEPFLLVKRYDRVIGDDDKIIRLHQEDFCQALGISPENKYEASGGPSLVDCFNLIAEHSVNPAKDKQFLLKWVMFNLLIGNADSHAKNLSLLYKDGDKSLSPFYDLLCTHIYPHLTQDFSMKIGGKKEARYLSVHDWNKLAENIGIKFSLFPEIRKELLNEIDSKIEQIKNKICVGEEEKSFIDSIVKIIEGQKKYLLRIE